MNRRKFIKGAAGLFVPAAPALILPKWARAQAPILPGPGLPVVAAPSEATVTLDANNSRVGRVSTLSGTNTTALWGNGGLTSAIGSGGTTNLCLLILVAGSGANGGSFNATALHWDPITTNQLMTKIPGSSVNNGSNGGDISAWYLMNPTLGNLAANITYTASGASQIDVYCISFFNVDQAGGITSFPVVNPQTSVQGATQSVTVTTSPTTRKIVGVFDGVNNYVSTTSLDMGFDNGSNIFAIAACYDAASAGSLNYTASGTPSPAILGFAIKGA